MSSEELRNLVAQLQEDLMETTRQKEEGHGQIQILQQTLEATENTVRHLSRKMKYSQPSSSSEHIYSPNSMQHRSRSEPSVHRCADSWSQAYHMMVDDGEQHGGVGIRKGNTVSNLYNQCAVPRLNVNGMQYGDCTKNKNRSELSPMMETTQDLPPSSLYSLNRIRSLPSSCIFKTPAKCYSDRISQTPTKQINMTQPDEMDQKTYQNALISSKDLDTTRHIVVANDRNIKTKASFIDIASNNTTSKKASTSLPSSNVGYPKSAASSTYNNDYDNRLLLVSPQPNQKYSASPQSETYTEKYSRSTPQLLLSHHQSDSPPTNLTQMALHPTNFHQSIHNISQPHLATKSSSTILYHANPTQRKSSVESHYYNNNDFIHTARDESEASFQNKEIGNGMGTINNKVDAHIDLEEEYSMPDSGSKRNKNKTERNDVRSRGLSPHDRIMATDKKGSGFVPTCGSEHNSFKFDCRQEAQIINKLQHLLQEKENLWQSETSEIKRRMKKENVLLMQENELLQEEVKLLKENVSSREKTIEDLKLDNESGAETLEKLEGEIEILKQEKTEMEEDLVKQHKELLDLDKTICKLEIAKRESDLQRKKKCEELDDNRRELAALEKELECYKNAHESLKGNLEEKEASLHDQILTVKKLTAERMEAKPEMCKKQKDFEGVQSEIELQKTDKSIYAKYCQLKVDYEYMQTAFNQKNDVEKQLLKEKAQIEDEANRLKEEINRLKNEKDRIESNRSLQIDDLEKQLADKDDLENRLSQIDFELKSKKGLEEEIASLRCQLGNKHRLEMQIRSKVTEKDALLNREKKQRAAVEEQLKEKSEKVKKRDKQCQVVCEKFNKLDAAFTKQTRLLREKTEALDLLKKRLRFYEETLSYNFSNLPSEKKGGGSKL